jgi:hypothetical protein
MTDRDIDAVVREGLDAPETPDALLAFLTITHPGLSEPIRVVSDVMDYSVWGQTFIGMPFDYQLLSDSESAPQTQIRMQNVDRRIGLALRQIKDRARLRLEIRSSADFNLSVDPRTEIGSSTIYAFDSFELVDVTVDAAEITGRVMLRDYSQETWPGLRATQSRCPALFR